MSRVIVLSDTHCESVKQLPPRVLDEMEAADLIIHAGDYISLDFIEGLRRYKLFYGVHGNMDETKIKSSLPADIVLDIEGFKVGLTHPPEGGPPLGIKRRIRKRFDTRLDAIIFGHTHRAEISEAYNILFMNPAALGGGFSCAKSYIVLDVSGQLRPKIVIV
ncbi:MAG: metallophosphoesterase family protein [Nitrososphaeria archaeon]